jgi:CelD/BcsL family acetyltransferase involved in cellulose biosynthesis
MSATRWTLHRLDRSLGEHAQAWDALNNRCFKQHPLLSALFVEGLLAAFGQGDEHLCRLDGEDGQAMAMCILQPKNRLAWQSFLASQAPLGLCLLPDAAQARQLFSALPGLPLQLDLLCNDPDLMEIGSLYAPEAMRLEHALTMHIDLAGSDFETYWEARPKKLRANIKRYKQRLKVEAQSIRFEVHEDPVALAAAVKRYAELETRGWKGREGTALGSGADQLRFYEKLLTSAGVRGEAAVYEYYIDEHLAASRLTIARGDCLVMLKTTYDETLSKFAPGRILLRKLLQHEFGLHRHRRVEFYTNANQDLLAWASNQRWIMHVSLYRTPLVSVISDIFRPVARHLRLGTETLLPAEQQVRRFCSPDDLPAHAKTLLESAAAESSSNSADWYANLARTVYAGAGELSFYTLEEQGQTVAVLPLRIERKGRSIHLHALSNFYSPLFEAVIAPSVRLNALVTLISALQLDHPQLCSVHLAPMAPESRSYQALVTALRKCGLPVFEFFCFENWYLSPVPSWAQYIASRSGQLRSTLKRKSAKFLDAGGSFELLTAPDQVSEGASAYLQVYSGSWKQPEPFPDFIPGLMETYARRGELRLGIARVQGRPVAVQLWLVNQGRAEIHKLAYDEAYKNLSPGSLLTAFMMRHAIEQDKVQAIDYLIGSDDYKRDWMSSRRERWGVVAYNPRRLHGMFGLCRELMGRAVRALTRKTTVTPASPATKACPGISSPQKQAQP